MVRWVSYGDSASRVLIDSGRIARIERCCEYVDCSSKRELSQGEDLKCNSSRCRKTCAFPSSIFSDSFANTVCYAGSAITSRNRSNYLGERRYVFVCASIWRFADFLFISSLLSFLELDNPKAVHKVVPAQ